MTSAERSRRYRERRRLMLQAPSAVARAGDPAIPDSALDEFTRAIRQERLSIIEENYGGLAGLTTVARWDVDDALDLKVLQEHLRRVVMPLAREGRLVQARRAHPAVEIFLKVQAAAARARERLGQGRTGPREPTLAEQARLATAEVAAQDALEAERERTGAPGEPVVEPGRLSHGHRGHEQAPEAAEPEPGPDPVGAF